MWVAKNSVTGKVYGKAYESIYDCQAFIDSNLKLLEYEMRRCFSLEEDFLKEMEIKNNKNCESFLEEFNLRFKMATDEFIENSDFANNIKIVAETCFKKGKSKRDLDIKLEQYARSNWLKNNVIRCYNVSQGRWADGFDF